MSVTLASVLVAGFIVTDILANYFIREFKKYIIHIEFKEMTYYDKSTNREEGIGNNKIC